ncbi:MAG: hypothetical protein ACRC0S_09270 [Fusobacteriaceae bacterium]
MCDETKINLDSFQMKLDEGVVCLEVDALEDAKNSLEIAKKYYIGLKNPIERKNAYLLYKSLGDVYLKLNYKRAAHKEYLVARIIDPSSLSIPYKKIFSSNEFIFTKILIFFIEIFSISIRIILKKIFMEVVSFYIKYKKVSRLDCIG